MGNEQNFWAQIGNSDEIFLATSADSVSDTDTVVVGETISGSTLIIDDSYSFFSDATVNLTSSSYSSLNAVDASRVTSNVHLIGNSRNNTLTGGTAGNTLDGGTAGDNYLIANASSQRDYYIHKGSGFDIALNFVGGTASTSDVAIFQKSSVTSVERDETSIVVMCGTGDGLAIRTSDAVIQYGNRVGGAVMAAKISSTASVDYEDGITYFCTQDDGTINVRGSNATSIWLGGEEGKYYGYIQNIDASTSTGTNVLAGNNNDNIIYAGAGTTSLWGGMGNDALVGGTGTDTFFYGLYEGNTFITNADLLDTVNLYNVNLSDIVASSAEGNFVSLSFRNGQSLTVESSNSLSANFKLANGAQYFYDHNAKTWVAAS